MSELRECIDCYHRGVDDGDDEVAACGKCGALQPADCDDYCPECNETDYMGIACPVCNGVYRLIEEASHG